MNIQCQVGLLILLCIRQLEASAGDRSVWYLECTDICKIKYNCSKSFGTFDWVQGDCFWCRYDCMWETVGHFESNFGKIPQFHGKWPFFAISLPFGLVIQEPASMLFSLLNLFTVIKMLSRFKNMKGIPNQKMWIVYAHIGVFTWISSSLFHMFDCDFTEKMDYLGAYTFVISAFYVSVIFMLPDMNHTQVGKIQKLVIQLFFITIFGKHMTDMLNLFDYGYNMFCCIIFSLFSTICYVYHLIKRKHNLGSLQEADILLIRIIVWANLATALELLDFVPVFWIFDSHSLFHLATIPIPIWWADFLDVTYEIDSSDRKRSILKMA